MFNINFIKKGEQQGMSLLEVMVAFGILALVFISLAQVFPLASAINKTAENNTKAGYLAQAKVEELASLDYNSIATGIIEAKHRLSSDPANYLYYFQRQTQVSYVDSNLADSAIETHLKKITITIYYTNALSKTEKTYNTIFLKTHL